MPSAIYNSFFDDLARGSIDVDSDTFKAMLVTSAYVPDKDGHLKRSQVTNEVVGAGYVAGGLAIAASVVKDTVNDRLDINFSDPTWPTATITARGLVIYKARGGAAIADELVAYLDFGVDVSSVATVFAVDITTPLRIQN